MPKKIKVPTLEVDYRFQKTISFSQYSTYRHCPHQWYLNYVKKQYDFKPSINLVFGTSMHETLQHYLQTMYEQSGAEADRIDVIEHFKERFREVYKASVKDHKGEHFSTPQEMAEFFEDGIAILEWFKSKRARYFSKRNTSLIGIEIPMLYKLDNGISNVFFRGHVDFILYDEANDKYTIYDIKTSTRGWTDYDKKDQIKINQILLYKRFFSQLTGVTEDKIDVLFFIVKRKIFESNEYTIPRIQEFKPANGKIKVKQAYEDFNAFIQEAFTPDGKYIEKAYEKKPSKLCDWCAFNNTEHCDKNNPQK